MPNSATIMIRAHGLEKHFGETHALRGIDLEVPEGRILAVLGPNGAGKTTAVRILATLLTRTGARRPSRASMSGATQRRFARGLA